MLPIFEVMGALTSALEAGGAAVLVAEPGAGKTTAAPLELLKAPWAADGKIILLEPRRVAARAAAARMAAALGESVGGVVGLRVRLQSRVSERTRLEVVTEGVFTRMVLNDPALEGVSAVIFDEFHERSLDADLGLALARETQDLLRPNLKLLVMSATLDIDRVAGLLGDAPVIQSRGRSHPVETRYLGRDAALSIEEQTARAVRRALMEETGGVLAFLPGQAEIRRVERALEGRLPDHVDLYPLHGGLSPAEQDAAVAPPAPGRRNVVLATAIAETSLTLEGGRVVIDSGLARSPAYDPRSGLTRLQTGRVSRATAEQRRGRAGRTQSGVCYRLWDEETNRGLAAFATPEMLAADLSGFVLTLLTYGAPDPSRLAFLDPPPVASLAEARALLGALGALDPEGRLTETGRRLADLPLPPRLGAVVLEGARRGSADRAALIAAVLSERGFGGEDPDLAVRLERAERARDPKSVEIRRLAAGWASAARRGGEGAAAAVSDGALLLAGFPDRLARRRGEGALQLMSGRLVSADPTGGLAGEPWVVAAELGGQGSKDRLYLAAAVPEAEALSFLAPRSEVIEGLVRGPGQAFRRRRQVRAGAFVLEERFSDPSGEDLKAILLQTVREEGLKALTWSPRARALRQRARFARDFDPSAPDLSDEALLASLEDWLGGLLSGSKGLKDITPGALDGALEAHAGFDALRRLDRLAPARFTAPTGSELLIDYGADGGPLVEVRVQELFGLASHPRLAGGRAPLTLALTSPAGRPIQITRDLPGFWAGSWSEVRKAMRGRYPKHPWPEDPLAAAPTTRAKPRGV